EGILSTINRAGFVTQFENEVFKKALNFGGNYFTVEADEEGSVDIYAVTAEGTVVKTDLPSLKAKEIVAYGGTYFMNNRGVVYTISNSGVVKSWEQMRIGVLSKRGGNYFSDSAGF